MLSMRCVFRIYVKNLGVLLYKEGRLFLELQFCGFIFKQKKS